MRRQMGWVGQAGKLALSQVAEIGGTDLMTGSGHGAPCGSTRADGLEVYARKAPR